MLSHSFRAYLFLVCAPLLSWNVRDSIGCWALSIPFPSFHARGGFMNSNLTRAVLGCVDIVRGTGTRRSSRPRACGDRRERPLRGNDQNPWPMHKPWLVAKPGGSPSLTRRCIVKRPPQSLILPCCRIFLTCLPRIMWKTAGGEQTQRGRTVGCRVHGYLPAEESARVIRTQVAGSSSEEQNRALRIVSTKDEGSFVVIQFQH